MSWFREEELKLSWLEKLAVNVIKQGKIPKHVAIIMDGNRRFSVKSHIEKSEGHKLGFDKLSQALQWFVVDTFDYRLSFITSVIGFRCLELEIKEVTVYAFSIENFKRSQDEVDTLMTLAREKFVRLMDEKEKIMERGVKIRVIGNFKLLPADLQHSIAEAMLMTKDNDKSILNVAFAYTSRDEITNSIAMIARGVEQNELQQDDLHHSLIDECLYTNKCNDVDLLVRTSGEMRFSDFLLWQVKLETPPSFTKLTF